jgi:hypothetical protein
MENLGSGLTLGGGVLNVEIYGVCEAIQHPVFMDVRALG